MNEIEAPYRLGTRVVGPNSSWHTTQIFNGIEELMRWITLNFVRMDSPMSSRELKRLTVERFDGEKWERIPIGFHPIEVSIGRNKYEVFSFETFIEIEPEKDPDD